MYARSTTIQAQPSSIDAGVAHVRDAVMPRLQRVDGCVGLSLLVDRGPVAASRPPHGKPKTAMRASAEQIRPVRDQAAQAFGGIGSPTVEEWEIAVLHRDHRSGEGACARATWVRAAARPTRPGHRVLPRLRPARRSRTRRLLQRQPAGRSRIRTRACPRASFDSLEAMNRNREQATALKDDEDPRSRAPKSSTTASSSSGSPICGHPSWSDRVRGRPAEPSDWVSAGIFLVPIAEQAQRHCPLPWLIRQRKVVSGTGGATGALPPSKSAPRERMV